MCQASSSHTPVGFCFWFRGWWGPDWRCPLGKKVNKELVRLEPTVTPQFYP